ncbi:MAG: J domain-containing protein [Coleofasciculaceae cyanobacterium]
MNLADCYRLLGLMDGASTTQVKTSYRLLARRYHPDVNAEKLAQEKFIQLTEAYKYILGVAEASGSKQVSTPPQTVNTGYQESEASKCPPTVIKVTRKPMQVTQLTEVEKQLKWESYRQLQQLLKECRFARAIALVEGLSQRIPQDPEVRQWQAITYQRWGRHLVNERQLDKARIYLKKALRTDAHNRSLWAEVEQDFRRIEKLL